MSKRSREERLSRVQELAAFDERMLRKAGSSSQHVSLPRNPPNPTPVRIAGFDEAGRGALAGPVVVGCVHFPFFFRAASSPDASVTSELVLDVALAKDNSPSLGYSSLPLLAGIDDSKRLTRRQREALLPSIKDHAVWGVGAASAAEIDKFGIVPAVSLAARRAYAAMGINVDLLLCDRGITVLTDSKIEGLNHLTPHFLNPPIPLSLNPSIAQSTELSFTRGDSRSLHIAAASILAKVTRDHMMVDLDQHFPGYDLAKHKGYGTASHIAALRKLGPSAIHRRTFHVK